MSAFDQGARGYLRGLDLDDCPHEAGSEEAMEWSDGWRSEEARDGIVFFTGGPICRGKEE